MAVKKVFWIDPYLTELVTTVSGVNGCIIMLSETIAYAFSGGQQSDSGAINDFPILNAVKRGKEIFYQLSEEHNLNIADRVILKIDWEKRYRIMKLHFAAELVLELVNKYFNNPEKIGANITSEKARIDFMWEGNINSIIPFLTDKIQELIKANHKIESNFSNEATETRYWEIEGFAKVSCGGTHIKRTGEIGNIRLKRERQGKNKERVEIYLTG